MSKLTLQFALYLCNISFTERTTRIIRASACWECPHSHQCEGIGGNREHSVPANNSRQCKSTLTPLTRHLRSDSRASHGVKQVWHEKSSSMAPTTIVDTLSVDVSSFARPTSREQIASAYGMTNSEMTRRMLSNRMNGRRRPYLLRHLSLARPITGTRKNPSAGPTPSIILMFCSLS